MDYKDNIVLIGMPGSGKTTVGRCLAALTAMTFLDLDDEIQRAAGKDIPRIFYEEGQEGFRLRETDCARKAAALRGFVIACGGGIILKEENMEALSRTGTVVFLDRSVEGLAASCLGGRPLLHGRRERLQELYDARIALYRKYAELTVPSSRAPEMVAQMVWEAISTRKEGD